jgi:hypothetical protein
MERQIFAIGRQRVVSAVSLASFSRVHLLNVGLLA